MINAIITDFDGTLVDTFEANLRAYQCAFKNVGMTLSATEYLECFGLRFDRFMEAVGINEENVAAHIKEDKIKYYPKFFDVIRVNKTLLQLIDGFRNLGGKAAVASTARRENLMNVIDYLKISDHFDLIFAGDDVKNGKPNPEIYFKAMAALQSSPSDTIVFEDSEIGLSAAKASGARYIHVTPEWFNA